jgi:hypothetical protein
MDVTGITARAYNKTVIFRHEVMLRTLSTFDKWVTSIAAQGGVSMGKWLF